MKIFRSFKFLPRIYLNRVGSVAKPRQIAPSPSYGVIFWCRYLCHVSSCDWSPHVKLRADSGRNIFPNLTGQLERSAVEPVPSDSSAAVEESAVKVNVELSLGLRSDDVGSRKQVREGVEAAEGKKPKMEEGVVPYGLQVMPVIFRGPNGYCYVCMVPCCVPSSVHAAENTQNSVYEPRINRNLAVATDGVAAGDCQEISGAGGLSSPGTSNSGTSVFQRFSAKEESSSTNESRNHSNNATTDNTSPISAFRNAEPGLKKPPTHPKRRNKPALSRKRRALVYTRSAEGKKIDGYLYECPKNEVRVLCHCHGTFFSPAGFVRHAGGHETQHPLRQITVVSP